MPRLKKPDARRQRSTRACVYCRKRKEKCNGEEPCAGCSKRGLECRFSAVNAGDSIISTTRCPQARPDGERSPSDEASDRATETQPADISKTQETRTPRQRRHRAKDNGDSEAPVPRSARLLSDGHGQLIYIGDSASVSFAQNVRRIVSLKIGECDFTNDIARHSFLEQTSTSSLNELSHFSPESQQTPLKPTLRDAEMLSNRYIAATSCIIDMFDKAELLQSFQIWIGGQSYIHSLNSGLLYLVLAIGAQAVNEPGYDAEGHRYFSLARQEISSMNSDEPCMQTVQCYMLLAMYNLGACRRNASYMNFGVAVRAAYALGLHRGDLYSLFSDSERRCRERVWHSLRIIDVFLSASLGRPPSTSDFEGYLSSQDSPDPSSTSVTASSMTAALSRLCPIFEKILFTVYKKQGVSTKVVDDISKSYRDWTSSLPELPVESESGSLELSEIIGSVHLLGAYHWSIILLTRPFLMFHISSNSRKSTLDDASSKTGPEIPSAATFAEACVDSALKAIDLTGDLPSYPQLPRRLPFVLNLVFNSALAIGSAFFGDYDRHLPLNSAMDKAERFLDYLQGHDPQAERYAQIISHLRKAAHIYAGHRDQLSMQRHRKLKISLFGDVGSEKSRTAATGTSQIGNFGTLPLDTHQNSSTGPPSSSSRAEAVQSPKDRVAGTQRVGLQYPDNRNGFSHSGMYGFQSGNDGNADVINPGTDLLARNSSTVEDFSSDVSPYNFTIPTVGLIEGLELDFEEQSYYRNFLMPMFP